jgi:hypothetical protein
MHEFHAHRDHAMCNIQNRTIPAVKLAKFPKLSTKNSSGIGVPVGVPVPKRYSNAKFFSMKWQHRQFIATAVR